MTCSDFLARFSEFHDGQVQPEDRLGFVEHLEHCDACRRYQRVVERGVGFLRTVPAERPRDDFRERLQHSIYHLEELERRRRNMFGPAGVMAIVVIAVVAALVWSPYLRDSDPHVRLAPIVVHEPAVPAALSSGLFRPHDEGVASFHDADLWTQSNALLYQHSTLFQRSRQPDVVRTGF